MKKDVLTTGKIAKWCQVSHRTILQWILDGKLKAYRTVGGHSRVEKEDLIAFFKKYNMPLPEQFKSITNTKKRILIIDDDKSMVKSIKGILVLENKYEVEFAFNGFSAGRKISEFMPDLITLDVRMPKMDGFEVCAQIRNDTGNNEIKIIIISGFMGKEEEKKMKELGADYCMRKPFKREELIKKIEELLN
jgi:excisionase family DNA binding protein